MHDCIATWDRTKLVLALAAWVAWDSEAPGIVSGEINWGVSQLTDHIVSFEDGVFEHSPEVFIAFRHIDVNLRLVQPFVQKFWIGGPLT